MISMIEVVNWNTTIPLLNPLLRAPERSLPFNTSMGLNDDKYMEGYNPAMMPIIIEEPITKGRNHHVFHGTVSDLFATAAKPGRTNNTIPNAITKEMRL